MIDDARLREFMRQLGRRAELFARIEPALVRYPAIDPETLRKAVDDALG